MWTQTGSGPKGLRMLNRRRALLAGAVIGAAALGIGWIWGDWLVKCLQALWALYGSPESIRSSVASFGIWAPLIFIGLQALQVVLSPIPGEATGVLGGFLFGTWVGAVYSTLGLTLGSALAFGLSRWLGLRLIERTIPAAASEKLWVVAGPRGVAVAFVLFTIPGFPKDYLSYLLGLTPMPWRSFLVVSTLGRIPGTWLLSAQGGAAGSEQYGSFAALASLAGGVLLLVFLYRHAIVQWLQGLSGIEGGDFSQR